MDNPILKIRQCDAKSKVPKYETAGSVGMDVSACLNSPKKIYPGCHTIVGTGLQAQVPSGYELQVRPRSGLAAKSCITVLNSPGTIDEDYRGEIKVILINLGAQAFVINPGDRIAQLILAPVAKATIMVVSRLEDTERGEGGLGSTGV